MRRCSWIAIARERGCRTRAGDRSLDRAHSHAAADRHDGRAAAECRALDVDTSKSTNQRAANNVLPGRKRSAPRRQTGTGSSSGVISQFDFSTSAIRTSRRADCQAKTSEANLWDACRLQARPRLEDLAQRISSTRHLGRHRFARDADAHLACDREAVAASREGLRRMGIRGTIQPRPWSERAFLPARAAPAKRSRRKSSPTNCELDLFRIDLSAVVSKYIGETEKNLRRVFDAAEEGGAVLLFDEADALFGKRSEVKDSHDRYANVEISYLLQRMEAYRGLAILTTNMKEALDPAFLRRLRFVVQFPFPDQAQRAEIWRQIFPAKTPTDSLDIDRSRAAFDFRRQHSQHRAQCRLRRRGCERAGADAAPAASRATRIRKARKTADRSRNWRLEMSPREINVHIEELVLHGFEPRARWQIGDALENELRRLLTARGIPPTWLYNLDRIEAGTIRATSLTKPAQAGAEIAGAAYRGVVK